MFVGLWWFELVSRTVSHSRKEQHLTLLDIHSKHSVSCWPAALRLFIRTSSRDVISSYDCCWTKTSLNSFPAWVLTSIILSFLLKTPALLVTNIRNGVKAVTCDAGVWTQGWTEDVLMDQWWTSINQPGLTWMSCWIFHQTSDLNGEGFENEELKRLFVLGFSDWISGSSQALPRREVFRELADRTEVKPGLFYSLSELKSSESSVLFPNTRGISWSSIVQRAVRFKVFLGFEHLRLPVFIRVLIHLHF